MLLLLLPGRTATGQGKLLRYGAVVKKSGLELYPAGSHSGGYGGILCCSSAMRAE